jgi:hypothetical protein
MICQISGGCPSHPAAVDSHVRVPISPVLTGTPAILQQLFVKSGSEGRQPPSRRAFKDLQALPGRLFTVSFLWVKRRGHNINVILVLCVGKFSSQAVNGVCILEQGWLRVLVCIHTVQSDAAAICLQDSVSPLKPKVMSYGALMIA